MYIFYLFFFIFALNEQFEIICKWMEPALKLYEAGLCK